MTGTYAGPVVDVDIHHGWKRPEDVLEYLPKRWREYATANEVTRQAGVELATKRSGIAESGRGFAGLHQYPDERAARDRPTAHHRDRTIRHSARGRSSIRATSTERC